MKRYIVGIVTIIAGILNANALLITDKQVSKVLKHLDEELAKRDVYIDARQSRIDSLKILYSQYKINDDAWLSSTMSLAEEYTAFNTDSALYYFNRGYARASELHLDSIALAFKIQNVTYMPLVGFIQEAVQEYESINRENVPESMLELYYDAGRQMYSYIASFYLNYPEEHDKWNKLSMNAQINLISVLDKSSPKYKLNQGEYYFANHEYSKAKIILLDLLNSVSEESNLYARAAHIISDIAQVNNEDNDFLYYLALSAIADIKSATLEVMSLQELGESLFKRNDVDRAHTYLSIALANAVKCHALMRMVQSAEFLPIIESAHRVEVSSWQNLMYAFIAGLVMMLMLLIGVLLFLRKEMKRMALLQQHLRDANKVKELYISQFLSLCSIYMDKLNQFSKMVNRKITTGKVDDLYKITKSGKFVEEQSKEFYDVFDNAFLHIYPDFVSGVNALLRDDEQIMLQNEEKLNTDLRILAFMRLGIEDSSRIAQILNYSVNTIYTYRNKLKNKAKVRESFDSDIMKISSVY
ncbi:MAG: hypothetical protein IJN66_04565 [Muribaculaceae bacterium]|nr:hypothetical protein [Muribaculaceae bacterium]